MLSEFLTGKTALAPGPRAGSILAEVVGVDAFDLIPEATATPTPCRTIKRASIGPSIRTIRLSIRSTYSRASLVNVPVVIKIPLRER
jgi:hypothetical protein